MRMLFHQRDNTSPLSSSLPLPNNDDSTSEAFSFTPCASPTSVASPFTVVLIVIVALLLLMAILIVFTRQCLIRNASNAMEARTGINKILIESLPLVAFSKSVMETTEGIVAECVVCLMEFEEEEKVRLLPKCNHVFHQECIDMWLLSHTTCPLCRQDLHDAVSTELGQNPRSVIHVHLPNPSTLVFNATHQHRNRRNSPVLHRALPGSSSSPKVSEIMYFRRSNSTGHSLMHSLHPSTEDATTLPIRLHRSKSYAIYSDGGLGEWRNMYS